MGFHREFADILEEMMKKEPLCPPPKASEKRAPILTLQPFLNFYTETIRWTHAPAMKFYPTPQVKKQETAIPKQTVKTKKEVAPIAEKMVSMKHVPLQTLEPLKILEQLGAQLGEEFSLSILRREYRRLAKIYHPDSQHSKSCAVRFQKVSSSYKSVVRELFPRQ